MADVRVITRIEGTQVIIDTFAEMKRGTRNAIVRPALRKGAKIVLDNAKIRLGTLKEIRGRRRTGQLRKSMGIVVRTYSSGNLVAVVGPRRGFRIPMGVRTRGKSKGQVWYHDPANIAHLVEKGHGGPHPAPAHSFLGDAWRTTRVRVEAMILQEILARLVKWQAKRAAKAA